MKYTKIRALILILTSTIFNVHLKAQKNNESVQLPEISSELMKMRDADQKMRVKWAGMYKKGKKDSPKFKEFTQKLIASDRANTARLREIIEQHGLPTFDKVGRRASNAAWLIAQHSDRNPLFQAKYLSLLKDAVDNEQAFPSNYAYLYDRVQVSKGAKQLYATQSRSNNGLTEGTFYAIADEWEVQKRREEMDIEMNVEDYAKSMGFDYEIPTKEEASQRAENIVSEYQLNLELAQKAMKDKDYKTAADKYLLVITADGSVTTDDFVITAKALSLSNHEQMDTAPSVLTKAMARGWDGLEKIKTHPDFENLRETNSSTWQDFMITAEEMVLDR